MWKKFIVSCTCMVILALGLTTSTILKKVVSVEPVVISPSVEDSIVIQIPPIPSSTPEPTPEPELKPLEFLPIKQYPILKISKNVDESNDIVIASPKLKYLKENSINIERVNIKETSGRKNFSVTFPRISGLIDTKIQDRINSELQDFAEKTIIYGKNNAASLNGLDLYFTVTANFNNLICINFNTQYQIENKMLVENSAFVYELVDGKRLELKDLLRTDSNYAEKLNSLVLTYLLEHNMEENSLKKPFAGIRTEQAFFFNESNFYLQIDLKNDEFIHNWFYGSLEIPVKIEKLPGMTDIYNRYLTPDKKIFFNENDKIKLLPNELEAIPVYFVENLTNKYSIQVSGLKFSKIGNSIVENALNNWCSISIPSDFKNNAIKADDKSINMSFYKKNYYVTANFMDLLCIECYDSQRMGGNVFETNFMDAIAYNIKSGKKLKLQDIFVDGFEYKKAIIDVIKNRNSKYEAVNLDELPKILDSDPKFWFNEQEFFIDGSLDKSTEQSGFSKIVSISFEEIGEKNITFKKVY